MTDRHGVWSAALAVAALPALIGCAEATPITARAEAARPRRRGNAGAARNLQAEEALRRGPVEISPSRADTVDSTVY